MRKQTVSSSLDEFRFVHLWDDDVVPVERYFTAPNPKEALEMFAYTCLKTGRKPILEEFSRWDRFRKSWIPIPITERDEFDIAENALVESEDNDSEQKPEEEQAGPHTEVWVPIIIFVVLSYL